MLLSQKRHQPLPKRLTAETLELDIQEQLVKVNDEPTSLGNRAFQLLLELMRNPQQLCTKQHLIETVWQDRVVTDAVLTTAMKEVRRALNDPARSPHYIETVHAKGYRFLLPVEISKASQRGQKKKPWLWVGLLSSVALFVVLAVMIYRLPPQKTVEANNQSPAPVEPAPLANAQEQITIAVMPFIDLSPDADQGYFSDGISEELLNVLTTVDRLKVASRTSSFSFKGLQQTDLPAIAQQLNVRYVLEGSVRKAGSNIRITAQLIDAKDDTHLWSETYDRTLTINNLFAIQDEISSTILRELLSQLNLSFTDIDLSVNIDTQSLDAYELYLQAKALFREGDPENIRQSTLLFEQALRLDPSFSHAWAGLALSATVSPAWGLVDRDYTELAKHAANQAITLNDKLAVPYATLGYLEGSLAKPNFVEALHLMTLAIERDPNEPNAYMWRGITLRMLGYFDRALADFTTCTQIDPGYLNCYSHMVRTYLAIGDAEAAIELWTNNAAQGSTSASAPLLDYFAMTGNHAALLPALRTYITSRPKGEDWMIEAIFKAWTDPDYPRRSSYLQMMQRLTANGFEPSSDPNLMWRLWIAFRVYEEIQPLGHRNFIWGTLITGYITSPHRKRIINELGMPEYWREYGFPEHCQPLDETDFECN